MNEEQEVLVQAVELLEAPLVWSADFEAIRHHLACWLSAEADYTPHLAAVDLAKALVALSDN